MMFPKIHVWNWSCTARNSISDLSSNEDLVSGDVDDLSQPNVNDYILENALTPPNATRHMSTNDVNQPINVSINRSLGNATLAQLNGSPNMSEIENISNRDSGFQLSPSLRNSFSHQPNTTNTGPVTHSKHGIVKPNPKYILTASIIPTELNRIKENKAF
ncbi:hypothetical protein NE237_005755 [Protea cynaroides]|uniref:Uncharacterized protein n=1 Tax=Protea cynaroides TaxID=273540 RepID=A0A9Q0KL96_9MAGN|nr:hypothetical protein NE237_005755 [Protea cynaroides]